MPLGYLLLELHKLGQPPNPLRQTHLTLSNSLKPQIDSLFGFFAGLHIEFMFTFTQLRMYIVYNLKLVYQGLRTFDETSVSLIV